MPHDEPILLQAVRPISKKKLDTPTTVATPAPTVYIDCHLDPNTQKNVVMWDDIRLVFADALYIRHKARAIPFLRGTDMMFLQPQRIVAMPDVTLDIVVDEPLTFTVAAVPQVSLQMTAQDSEKETLAQDETSIQKEGSANSITAANIPKIKTPTAQRNPEYGLVEAAMQNYNHIDNPAFGPQPRAPQYIPTSDDDSSNDDESVVSRALILEQPAGGGRSTDIKPPQAPQDHTAAAGVTVISPIVMKATLGDANSQVDLGTMHKFGDGVEQDYEAARYWYLKAAKQGDASAQCNIGDLYRLGLGVEFNHSTALSWYLKAVDQGDASGQCNLGRMYQYGLAVEVDYAVAMDWYRKSADQGHAIAQSRIADLYFHGLGVPMDYSKTMEWLLLAASQDLPVAYFNVGLMHFYGIGVVIDKDVALGWFHKATAHSDTDAWAQICMSFLYLGAIGGRPQDYSKAREWALKSAHQGLPEAYIGIANLYFYGYGVPKDYTEAMIWYRIAANQHHPEAQYNIGRMHRNGHGVPKDSSIAKKWYSKAARQMNQEAQEGLDKLQ
ncbi:hypothetical protein BGZ95_003757 [Linnemannia exigua]|uniref:HCP-like protein n=1 Tax=Linnemannia exigua TaxID=604196 RepID=A0AAD4DHW3_9FUNG|nr:hypothetical protein BGZ95_003757 [Linnemannia exigua]